VLDDDTLRIGRRAGGEQHLGDVVACHSDLSGSSVRRFPLNRTKRPFRDRKFDPARLVAPYQQCRLCDSLDGRNQIAGRPVVDRNDNGACEHAAPECSQPLGTVLAPKKDLVAFPNAEVLKPERERPCRIAELGVCVAVDSQAVVVDEELIVGTRQILEHAQQGVSVHLSSSL
jgi:hypothetical protein